MQAHSSPLQAVCIPLPAPPGCLPDASRTIAQGTPPALKCRANCSVAAPLRTTRTLSLDLKQQLHPGTEAHRPAEPGTPGHHAEGAAAILSRFKLGAGRHLAQHARQAAWQAWQAPTLRSCPLHVYSVILNRVLVSNPALSMYSRTAIRKPCQLLAAA